MKYSSTTRLINVILFALFGFGFGWLGIYFGILVAPYLWTGLIGPVDRVDGLGWGLPAMLGVTGLAGLIVCLYGLVNSVLSLVKNDDILVRRSLSAYVGLGYLVALFFFLNATWLYRLTSTNIGYDDVAFVIVVFTILCIASIIVSNIPMIRMYGETEELNKIMRVITGPLVAITCAITLVYGLSFFALVGANAVYQQAAGSREFGIGALFGLVGFILSFLAFIGYGRADKQGKISKLNGLLFEGSILVIGAGIIVAGILEFVSQSGKNPDSISLMAAKSVPNTNANYVDFGVMSWIIGGLLVILALGLALSTLKGNKEKQN